MIYDLKEMDKIAQDIENWLTQNNFTEVGIGLWKNEKYSNLKFVDTNATSAMVYLKDIENTKIIADEYEDHPEWLELEIPIVRTLKKYSDTEFEIYSVEAIQRLFEQLPNIENL